MLQVPYPPPSIPVDSIFLRLNLNLLARAPSFQCHACNKSLRQDLQRQHSALEGNSASSARGAGGAELYASHSCQPCRGGPIVVLMTSAGPSFSLAHLADLLGIAQTVGCCCNSDGPQWLQESGVRFPFVRNNVQTILRRLTELGIPLLRVPTDFQ